MRHRAVGGSLLEGRGRTRSPGDAGSEGEAGFSTCGHDEAETDGIVAAGDGLPRYADYQTRESVTVSRTDCGHTGLDRRSGDGGLVDPFFD